MAGSVRDKVKVSPGIDGDSSDEEKGGAGEGSSITSVGFWSRRRWLGRWGLGGGGGGGGAGGGTSGSGSSGIAGSGSAAVRSSTPSGRLAGKLVTSDREAVAAGRAEGSGTGTEVAQERGRGDGGTRHTAGVVTSNAACSASEGTASAASGFPPKGGRPATKTTSPTSFRSPVISPRFADLPLPEMVHESLLLTDACRREICNALPTLAAGRAWVLLYR